MEFATFNINTFLSADRVSACETRFPRGTQIMKVPISKNELRRLEALRNYQILDSAPEREFDDVVKIASHICGVPLAKLTFVDSDQHSFKPRMDIEKSEAPQEDPFCAQTISSGNLLVVEDATADPRFADSPSVTGEPHIRFYAGAPLIDAEGNSLGALCVIDPEPRSLTDEQEKALEALARLVVSQMELRRVSHALAEALYDVRTLQGLLPICAHCHGIRNDEGYWERVEEYLGHRTEAELSHGICPKCFEKRYPEAFTSLQAQVAKKEVAEAVAS
jgi:GAF domain